MINATLNEVFPLEILAADGRTDLYAQFRVYDAGGTLIDTINGTHVAEGLYRATYNPDLEGYFTAVGELYFDNSFLIDAGYERAGELIEVTEIKTNILRILGLQHQNSVVDQQVYDGNKNLVSGRVRCYDTEANATAGGNTGVLFVYTLSAEYSGGLLTKYTMVKIQ